MPKEYRYIKRYEKEILKLKEQGMTLRKLARSMALHMSKYTTLFHGTTHENANWRQE